MPLVKLTIRDDLVDVAEEDIPNLRAQGLLADEPARPAAGVRSPVTEVKDQTAQDAAGEPDDQAKAETAGEQPGTKESE